MGYVLGIDGGLLRTYCLIADTGGQILGLGKAGGSNLATHDPDEARANILAAIKQARAAAGIRATDFEAACLGISGFSALGAHDLAEEMMASVVKTAKPLLEDDSSIALYGATGGDPGVVVLAGPGSVAYGMNAAGDRRHAGGWGHILGDEGSMYWMGLSSLRALARSHDAIMPKTAMTAEIFKHFGVARIHELMELVYHQGLTKSDILSVAPITIKAAQEGDEVAGDVVARAADCLASIARAVIRRLKMDRESFPLATSGNVFDAGPVLMDPFKAKIALFAPKAEVAKPKFDPVVGATLMALHAIGVKPKEEAIAVTWSELRSSGVK